MFSFGTIQCSYVGRLVFTAHYFIDNPSRSLSLEHTFNSYQVGHTRIATGRYATVDYRRFAKSDREDYPFILQDGGYLRPPKHTPLIAGDSGGSAGVANSEKSHTSCVCQRSATYSSDSPESSTRIWPLRICVVLTVALQTFSASRRARLILCIVERCLHSPIVVLIIFS